MVAVQTTAVSTTKLEEVRKCRMGIFITKKEIERSRPTSEKPACQRTQRINHLRELTNKKGKIIKYFKEENDKLFIPKNYLIPRFAYN